MKFALAGAFVALLLAACGGPATPAPTGETPAAATPAAPAGIPASMTGPAAGKWKVEVSAGGIAIPPNEICYAKQMTIEEAQKMQQQSGMTCADQTYAADGKTGHSVCTLEGMTIITDFAVTGDFNTAYTMQMSSSMDPAPAGMPQPSTTTIKMERLGECDPATSP
jgi:hypothetical protein